jgi:hypothetical protein
MFLVYARVILGYIVSKEGKLLDPKKSLCNHEHATTKNPQGHSGFQWDGSILPMIHLGFCIHHGPNHQAIVENGSI